MLLPKRLHWRTKKEVLARRGEVKDGGVQVRTEWRKQMQPWETYVQKQFELSITRRVRIERQTTGKHTRHMVYVIYTITGTGWLGGGH